MGPDVAMLLKEGLVLLATTGAPIFLTLLGVGLAIGVLQAATQVNDPAVGALPRLAVVLFMAMVLGGWMMHRLSTFFGSALERMAAL